MSKREYVVLDTIRIRKALKKANVTMSVFARFSGINYNRLNDHIIRKEKTTAKYRDNVMAALEAIDKTDKWKKYREWQERDDDWLEDIPITAADVDNFT